MLFVRARPRARGNAIGGIGHDADGRAVLQLRIAAPPAEGAANAALINLLSTALQVRKRDVSLKSGATGRAKQFRIEGDGAALVARLEALIASCIA
ncbi:DUF167 family protein [Blastomonas natatoria]|uniref:DUF167 family protein n=1 Tax=Blastomonas natatoria TaxID=34015 RepID=UPI001FC9A648|nr:DUF167 family protein [Blastomonas natatoria]